MGKTLYDKLWDSHVIQTVGWLGAGHRRQGHRQLYAAKAALAGRAGEVWELVTDNFAWPPGNGGRDPNRGFRNVYGSADDHGLS
jgi:hypothetical protein